MRRLLATAAVALAALGGAIVGGCGASGQTPALKVSAATSLKDALSAYDQGFRQARVAASFGGSDLLAAQIEQGAAPDVYAAANATLPEQLYARGLVEKPVPFARNRLVLAVPAGSAKVRSLADATKPGVKIAIGSATVPVGSYTRAVLARLPAGERRALLANVRSEEPDVGGIVGKLTQGAVDVGFVYVTDVAGTKGALKRIDLPAALQPVVVYEAAVVKGTKHPGQANAYVDGLVHGDGRAALRRTGFLPPP